MQRRPPSGVFRVIFAAITIGTNGALNLVGVGAMRCQPKLESKLVKDEILLCELRFYTPQNKWRYHMFKNSLRTFAFMFAAAAAMCFVAQEASAQSCGYRGGGFGGGFGGSGISLNIGTGYGGGFNRGFSGGGLYGGNFYGGGRSFYGGSGLYNSGFNRGIGIQSYRPSYGRSYGYGSFNKGGFYGGRRY